MQIIYFYFISGTVVGYDNISMNLVKETIDLFYIRDLCNVSRAVDLIVFADGTNIFFSHKDPDVLSETLNSEMIKFSQWCQANCLSIIFNKR